MLFRSFRAHRDGQRVEQYVSPFHSPQLLVTDHGYLSFSLAVVFVCGNGGANPRHATLFARDVPPSRVIRILDRFIMYYIRTADKLTRTARWLESMEGGVEVRRRRLFFST